MTKRKYQESCDFTDIKRSKKGEYYAYCILCNDDISLAMTGKTAISIHQKTGKHMKAAAAANRTKGIKSFLPSTSAPTSIDMKVAAAEGAFAYHIAKHAQSFKSTNCVSSDGLFKTIFPDSAIATLKLFLGLCEKQEVAVVGSRPWDKIPNPKNYQYFEVKNVLGRWFRWYYWNHMCGFQKLGLLFHDQFFEQCAEVTEALRRLQMKEPHVYDARIQRLSRGTLKAQENEYLPKEEWTKWEEREKAILPELLDEMQKFREKIRERARQKFYDVVTGTLLRRLSEEEAQVLEEQFQYFYKSALDYVDNWFRLEHYPSNLSWIGLR